MRQTHPRRLGTLAEAMMYLLLGGLLILLVVMAAFAFGI